MSLSPSLKQIVDEAIDEPASLDHEKPPKVDGPTTVKFNQAMHEIKDALREL